MTNNFILNGFDRSGTSAISRTLATHPDVELIFRPFNSGPIREKMYRIFSNDVASVQDRNFFEFLEQGELQSEYFVSTWHKKFSTVQNNFAPEKLHVIITNINHFTVKWVKEQFPGIEQWAIWRDPLEILNSCVKNQFYGEWYSDALDQVSLVVRNEEELNILFGTYLDSIKEENYTIKTAYLLAVRNYFLFKNIEETKIIDYHTFRTSPNAALKNVVQYFNLKNNFDFNDSLSVDLNSIPSVDGYSQDKSDRLVLSKSDLEVSIKLLEPLYKIYEQKNVL